PMGDPAGIGPEITIKSLKNSRIYNMCKPVVVGDVDVLKRANKITESNLNVNVIQSPKDGKFETGTVDVINLDNINIDELRYGQVKEQCGRASFDYIETSVNLALNGYVKALATTPINKESLKTADMPYIGHTEMLESLTNTKDPLTMFEVQNMRI